MERNSIMVVSCVLCMVLNDSVQRLSWLFFSFVLLGVRLLRAGKLVSFLCLSAYESSAFESGLVGQSGASIWKIFSPGELVTVRMKGVLENWGKRGEVSSACS